MEEFFDTFVSGVISGIVASLIFLLFMLLIRPKITISDKMSIDKDGIYQIKVVNKSFFRLSEVKYTLNICDDHGDSIVEVDTLSPFKSPLESIPKFSLRDKNSMYAVRISYKPEDGKCILNKSNSYIEFTFSGKHTFSNTYKTVSKKYKCDDIVFGVFETGISTNIIRYSKQNCHELVSCAKKQ